MRPGRWFSELGWRHVVGVIAVVYAAFPLVYVLSASLSENGTLTGSNSLFSDVSTANYAQLGTTMFWTWMGNTLVIAVATSVGTVLMGAAAAYAFSRFRFSGRRAGLTSLLIIQMFPQMLAFVASSCCSSRWGTSCRSSASTARSRSSRCTSAGPSA